MIWSLPAELSFTSTTTSPPFSPGRKEMVSFRVWELPSILPAAKVSIDCT